MDGDIFDVVVVLLIEELFTRASLLFTVNASLETFDDITDVTVVDEVE